MQKTILVAEDEPMILRIIAFKLEMEGHRVLQAKTGPEVVENLKQEKPDLLLLDATLPDMNSFEILQNIRSDYGLKNLPIFMLTQTHEPWQAEKAMELGATQCIVKPFKPTVLAKQVRNLFEST